MNQSVCAVIVTYHPTAEMVQHLAGILAQAQGLVVVDNGSNIDELAPLRAARNIFGFHLIENGENLGIAEALNRGGMWAKSQGYPWVILFDQDSRITDGFIEQMLKTWEAHPDRDRVGSVHPRYLHPETGIEPLVRRASDGGPVISITSGALMPVRVFDAVGWFASEYFIDEVDTEFCYRLRAAGYLVADSRRAVLFHTVGHPKEHTILGFSFRPMHHNATRRYYMTRNRVVLYRTYFRRFPRWIIQSFNEGFRETLKCFLGEQDRARKFRNLMLGAWDGLRGKMGKRQGI